MRAIGRLPEAGQELQERALARAVRSYQRHQFSPPRPQAHVVERQRSIWVAERHSLDRHQTFAHLHLRELLLLRTLGLFCEGLCQALNGDLRLLERSVEGGDPLHHWGQQPDQRVRRYQVPRAQPSRSDLFGGQC